MDKNLTPKDYRFFAVFSLFWLSFGWLFFLLTLFDIFKFSLLLAGSASLLITFSSLIVARKLWQGLSREFILAGAFFLLSAVIFSSFATPSVFSGRDQGSISETAIRLTQNQKLEYSTEESRTFFKIYGPGRALNFPGFHYNSEGNLITQFPLAYTAWIAAFFSFFGLAGFPIANGILLFLFFLAFFLLYRSFAPARYAAFFCVLAATSFVFSWFAKFTLSENLALALLWIGILSLVRFVEEPGILHYANLLSAFALLFFTRLEGILVLPFAIGAMIRFSRTSPFWQSQRREKLFIPAAIFAVIALLNFGRDFYFYKEIGKTLFGSDKGLSRDLFNVGEYLSNIAYTGKIFALYGILAVAAVGLAGLIGYLRKREFFRLIPFFVTLPTFIYLIDPNISADHPWMLRRFAFSVIPALLLYSALGAASFLEEKKRHAWIPAALLLLILTNLYPFGKYLSFSENRGLLPGVESLSSRFSDRDLILVDRLSGGSGWAMPSGPLSFLYHKRAVYFFNPNDLAKIDLGPFEKVYLLVSDANVGFYENSSIGGRLMNPQEYSLSGTQLKNNEMVRLPWKETVMTKGKLFEISKQ